MLRAALALAASFACGGCHHDSTLPGPSGSSSTTPPLDAGGTFLGAEDDGKTLDLSPGDTLTLRLPTHGGTGFVWVPAARDGGDGSVVQVGERTSELSSGTPGAPKLDVYRLVARGPGTATVEMDLRRPWGDQPPVKTWRVTVNVR